MDQDTGPADQHTAPAERPVPAEDEHQAAEESASAALPQTGEPRVDSALAQLAGLDGLPVSEHPQVYEGIHGELVEVLGELHSGPAG